MDDEALQACYERLGLSPKASTRDVERSFRELRDLYGDESLATYSLLEFADRKEKIESLQDAYDRILQSRLHSTSSKDGVIVLDEQHMLSDERIICVDADPDQMPGLFLKQMRETQGLTLSDVAERTKVGTFQLQGIEQQRFDILPAPVYLRGFLKAFARVVKVANEEGLVDSYIALYLKEKDE